MTQEVKCAMTTEFLASKAIFVLSPRRVGTQCGQRCKVDCEVFSCQLFPINPAEAGWNLAGNHEAKETKIKKAY
jgi:hypothetical protein